MLYNASLQYRINERMQLPLAVDNLFNKMPPKDRPRSTTRTTTSRGSIRSAAATSSEFTWKLGGNALTSSPSREPKTSPAGSFSFGVGSLRRLHRARRASPQLAGVGFPCRRGRARCAHRDRASRWTSPRRARISASAANRRPQKSNTRAPWLRCRRRGRRRPRRACAGHRVMQVLGRAFATHKWWRATCSGSLACAAVPAKKVRRLEKQVSSARARTRISFAWRQDLGDQAGIEQVRREFSVGTAGRRARQREASRKPRPIAAKSASATRRRGRIQRVGALVVGEISCAVKASCAIGLSGWPPRMRSSSVLPERCMPTAKIGVNRPPRIGRLEEFRACSAIPIAANKDSLSLRSCDACAHRVLAVRQRIPGLVVAAERMQRVVQGKQVGLAHARARHARGWRGCAGRHPHRRIAILRQSREHQCACEIGSSARQADSAKRACGMSPRNIATTPRRCCACACIGSTRHGVVDPCLPPAPGRRSGWPMMRVRYVRSRKETVPD